MDAHAPYKLPDGAQHRFGHKPRSRYEIRVFHEGWDLLDKLTLPKDYLTMARDAYDSCLAYLDEQLGMLFDELHHRALLDDTLVVIASDHGEGLGEHDLFDHGESLYGTELDVPLLILLPLKSRTARVVRQVVSLRDLPATIVDLVGQGAGSPFPGYSMANLCAIPTGPRRLPVRPSPSYWFPTPQFQPETIAGLSRSTDCSRRRRFCLHPQPGRRRRGIIRQTR